MLLYNTPRPRLVLWLSWAPSASLRSGKAAVCRSKPFLFLQCNLAFWGGAFPLGTGRFGFGEAELLWRKTYMALWSGRPAFAVVITLPTPTPEKACFSRLES